MGNNKSTDQQFVNSIKKFFQTYFENSQPLQFRNMFDNFQAHRSQCCYGTPYRSNQYYAKISQVCIRYYFNASFYYGDIDKQNSQQTKAKGVIYYCNSNYYKGQFRNGKPDGLGELINTQVGCKLQEGQWKQGKFIKGNIRPKQGSNIKKISKINQQQYEIQYNDKSAYKGQGYIQNNIFVMDGKGTFQNTSVKYKYQGQWKKNIRQGECKVETAKQKFQGTYKNNMKYKGKLLTPKFQLQGEWLQQQSVFQGKIKNLANGAVKQNVKMIVRKKPQKNSNIK